MFCFFFPTWSTRCDNKGALEEKDHTSTDPFFWAEGQICACFPHTDITHSAPHAVFIRHTGSHNLCNSLKGATLTFIGYACVYITFILSGNVIESEYFLPERPQHSRFQGESKIKRDTNWMSMMDSVGFTVAVNQMLNTCRRQTTTAVHSFVRISRTQTFSVHVVWLTWRRLSV